MSRAKKGQNLRVLSLSKIQGFILISFCLLLAKIKNVNFLGFFKNYFHLNSIRLVLNWCFYLSMINFNTRKFIIVKNYIVNYIPYRRRSQLIFKRGRGIVSTLFVKVDPRQKPRLKVFRRI